MLALGVFFLVVHVSPPSKCELRCARAVGDSQCNGRSTHRSANCARALSHAEDEPAFVVVVVGRQTC